MYIKPTQEGRGGGYTSERATSEVSYILVHWTKRYFKIIYKDYGADNRAGYL